MKAFLYFWGLGAAPAVLLSTPVVALGWRRVHWYWWELLGLILPFAAWLGVMCLLPPSEKSWGISNLFGEPILIGLLVPAGALIRVLIGKDREQNQKGAAAAVVFSLCVAAALLYLALPNLGGTI